MTYGSCLLFPDVIQEIAQYTILINSYSYNGLYLTYTRHEIYLICKYAINFKYESSSLIEEIILRQTDASHTVTYSICVYFAIAMILVGSNNVIITFVFKTLIPRPLTCLCLLFISCIPFGIKRLPEGLPTQFGCTLLFYFLHLPFPYIFKSNPCLLLMTCHKPVKPIFHIVCVGYARVGSCWPRRFHVVYVNFVQKYRDVRMFVTKEHQLQVYELFVDFQISQKHGLSQGVTLFFFFFSFFFSIPFDTVLPLRVLVVHQDLKSNIHRD